jgi:hypothetical protein
MSIVYHHNYLNCRNQHSIPIPNSVSLQTTASLQATEVPTVIVLCPECGLVSSYSRERWFGGSFHKPDLFQLGECRLVSTQVECDGENCKAAKTVHAILKNVDGVWKVNIEPQNWQFDETAKCQADDKLYLPKDKKVYWIAVDSLPF